MNLKEDNYTFGSSKSQSDISEEDFLHDDSLYETCECVGPESTPETTSVFEVVRNWAKAAKRMIVSDILNIDQLLVDGFIEYLTSKYPKIKNFEEAPFKKLPIFKNKYQKEIIQLILLDYFRKKNEPEDAIAEKVNRLSTKLIDLIINKNFMTVSSIESGGSFGE